MDSWLLILILVLLLTGASFCAATEISYSSINKIRLKNHADNGSKRARMARWILEHFDSALVTLLIGNNLTHNGFAAIATVLSTRYFGSEYLTLTTLLSTLIVFLFSEMIPKSFGKSNYNYALNVAFFLKLFIRLLKPVSLFFMGISKIVTKLFPEENEPEINEEEFFQIVKDVGEEGVISERDHQLISSALNFDRKKVADIYTPMQDVVSLDIATDKREIVRIFKDTGFSRYPVFDGGEGNFIGVLQTKAFYRSSFKDRGFDVRDILLKPFYTGPDMLIDDLMNELSKNKIHFAMVVDRAGRKMGIVTLTDILEELIGEIRDRPAHQAGGKEALHAGS
ncbi:MAG: CNNM domain-containing protein [Bacillota bacterium]|nr:CNNM domain-containing protein [Bacillota bacterium]